MTPDDEATLADLGRLPKICGTKRHLSVAIGRYGPFTQDVQQVVDVWMAELPDVMDRASLSEIRNTLLQDPNPYRRAAGQFLSVA